MERRALAEPGPEDSGIEFKEAFRPGDAGAKLGFIAALEGSFDSKTLKDFGQVVEIRAGDGEALEAAACGGVGGRMK